MVVAEGVRRSLFVGRTRELGLLRGIVDGVTVGGPAGGSAVVVVGEPGIGKTALLEQVAGGAPRAVWVRGVESESVLPFAAAADLLLPLREHFDHLPAVQRDALDVALALASPRPGPGTLSPLAVCAGALGVLAAAGERGLVVIVDDYQSVDPSSRQILSFVARRLAAERVAMIFAVRDGLRGTAVPLDLPTLHLAGLSVEECAQLAAHLRIDVSAAVLAEIVDQTGGNALAVIETLAGQPPEVLRGAIGLPGASPGHAPAAWSGAVDELPEATRTVLFALAVAGRPARAAEIEAALAALGCSLADLEPAERAGLVRTTPTLVLRHPLLRAVVVDRTPLAARLEIYRALAAHADPTLRAWYRAAATTGPDDAVADDLAAAAVHARGRSGYHESARTWQRAAVLTRDRARRAERLLAAATDAQVAGDSELADVWCDEASRLRADPGFVADVELVRGRARTWLGRLPHAATDLVRAGDAVLEHDPARAARLYAEAVLPLAMANRLHEMLAVALRSEMLEPAGGRTLSSAAMSAVALALRGDAERARDRLEVGERLARGADPVASLPNVCLLATCRGWVEDFAGARRQAGWVLDHARRAGASSVFSMALAARSDVDAWAGNWSAAYVDASEALRWAEELQQAASICYALVALARLDAARAEIAQCHTRLDRARVLATEHGVDWMDVHIPAVRGFAALGIGDHTAAEHLAAARTAADRGGLGGPNVVPFAGDLVEAWVHAGHRGRAAEALERLDERAASTGLVHPAAAAARGHGILAEDPDLAGASFTRAMELHDRCPMPFERARTLLCWGETLRRMRQPAAARPLLREARGVFDGLGARPWATRAGRELAAAGASPAAGDGAPDLVGLTPQEFQIARAVAEGMSNTEVASAIFVSRKTVEAHLTRVYRKLGLRSRTELARSFARVPSP